MVFPPSYGVIVTVPGTVNLTHATASEEDIETIGTELVRRHVHGIPAQ